MDYKVLIKWMRDISMQTGGLSCLGCGYEHNCSIHGCAVLKDAAAALSALSDEVFGLKAELETARAERDAAVEDLQKNRKHKCVCCAYASLSKCSPCSACQSSIGTYMDLWQWRGPKEAVKDDAV